MERDSVSPINPLFQEVTREEKTRELENILQSAIVREHTYLHSLLVYLGKKSIENGSEHLKEYTIGVEALGKPPNYDPRIDPVARVEIGKLRAKLAEYYQKEGAAHPVRLEIPKGRYNPTFNRVAPLKETTVQRSNRFARHIAIVSLIIFGVITIYALQRYGDARLKPQRLSPELETFWQPYLKTSVPTLIVYGTPLFIKMDGSYYRHSNINLPEEFKESETIEKLEQVLQPIEKRETHGFTGTGEAEALFMLTQLFASEGVRLMIKRSSNLSWEDIKGKHVVIVGSQKFNPQIANLPYTPKFISASSKIINLKPAEGEPAEYPTVYARPHGEIIEEYALISVYPGLEPQTQLVILSCYSTEGTGAATEYATRQDTMRGLLEKMNLNARAPLPKAFQVVVKAKLNSGIPVKLSYVTHHIISP